MSVHMADETVYPLALNGVFRTIQGEGHLLGEPMVFIRLAGCSVGCRECDTDYRVDRKATGEQIADEVSKLLLGGTDWIWITGGEPTDRDLMPLRRALWRFPLAKTCLATSGVRELPLPQGWLSVSPHNPAKWKQRQGSELKIVPGLNGFWMRDFEPELKNIQFGHKFVSPLAGSERSVRECVEWVYNNPNWRMTCQAHKQWNLA